MSLLRHSFSSVSRLSSSRVKLLKIVLCLFQELDMNSELYSFARLIRVCMSSLHTDLYSSFYTFAEPVFSMHFKYGKR